GGGCSGSTTRSVAPGIEGDVALDPVTGEWALPACRVTGRHDLRGAGVDTREDFVSVGSTGVADGRGRGSPRIYRAGSRAAGAN
ncbi:MAG: hypothetical protein M0Z47_11770, partial [Actinomycetota bacterium]|nr:hypothetical protein [Actinomycetota bacterium]